MVDTFVGAVYAMVLVAFANVATVRWTNPPAANIARVDWYVCKAGDACSTAVAPYYGRQLDPMDPPHLLPGRKDSLYVTMPAHTDSVTYKFWYYVTDSTGHRYPKSAITTWTNKGGQ